MAIQTLSMTIKTVSVPKAHTTATQEEGEDHALSQKAKKEDKEHKGKKLLATIMLAAREQSATEEHKANAAAPKEEGREDHAPCGLRAHHQLQATFEKQLQEDNSTMGNKLHEEDLNKDKTLLAAIKLETRDVEELAAIRLGTREQAAAKMKSAKTEPSP